MVWVQEHAGWIAFVVSEILVLIPGVKANSVVQLVVNLGKEVFSQVSEKLKA